jgi:hypothetical protein
MCSGSSASAPVRRCTSIPETFPGCSISRPLQKTYISGRHADYIDFLIGGNQRFAESLVTFPPRIGDFYIFPGWLLHGAEPSRGAGERRSLAFNAYVDAP